MPDLSVCEHGGLRRKCEICGLRDELARIKRERDVANVLLRAVQPFAHFDIDEQCSCEPASLGLPEYSHPGYYCEVCQASEIEQALTNHLAALDRAKDSHA